MDEGIDNCKFLGQIPHEDLPQFYKLCKVHVLPSWMETPGLSSLEAAVMNSNIVITEKGDTRDYFGDNAWYCEPNNVLSIRNAVIKAMESKIDPQLSLIVSQKYNWDKTAEATLAGYKLALK